MTSDRPRAVEVCRVYPHEDADGPRNMGRDQAMLEHVAREPSAAALRTYGWSEPTLSLGYFQSIRDVEADPRWRGAPVVRRPTGGGALWHDREITYALALPPGHRLARPNTALYRAVHGAIVALLAGLGVAARRKGDLDEEVQAKPNPSATARPFLCFVDRDAEDLVMGTAKVVGSAQRRRDGVVLQHGSVLLRVSPRTPELPGLADLAPLTAEPAAWAAALAPRTARALGLEPVAVEWDASLLQRADELARTVYGDLAWTRRR